MKWRAASEFLPCVIWVVSLLGGCGHGKRMEAALKYLSPAGAHVVATREKADQCYHHVIWRMKTTRSAVEEWTQRIDLPCARKREDPCSHWSSDARASPFWAESVGELDGLDSVEASFDGDIVTVDFGDYLCSGPN